MPKSLLDIQIPVITRAEFAALLATGKKLTPAHLYEPEHAPRGTKFVKVQFSPSRQVPYRIW